MNLFEKFTKIVKEDVGNTSKEESKVENEELTKEEESQERKMKLPEPQINVISKEEFEERVEKVFHLLWQTLSKSFGPYGAPTMIYKYPYSHVTKDGYTIMKSLSLNAADTYIDQAIADMAADICGRLNYSVGDGTTSAVIATNSIFQNYRMRKCELKREFVLPRDVIKKYDKIKEEVIENLEKKVKPIRSLDADELYKNIYDVVYVSSNGDETMTNYIAEFYRELGCPAISCVLASDGITKKKLIDGYKYNLSIIDNMYINSDDNVMNLDEADILIFSTKVTQSTYNNILKPLNACCRAMGRHLIVAAPYYDEKALMQVIRRDLNNEFQKTKDVNMVLTSYRATSAHARKLVEDFAVLCNTYVIDRALESSIMDDIQSGKAIYEIFNIYNRDNIPGLRCGFLDKNDMVIGAYIRGEDEIPEGCSEPEMVENFISLGYVKDCSLGLKDSIFHEFFYNKNRYDAIYKDAEVDLMEKEKKYQKLGTFNLEVSQAQERLYGLNLKMGIIEVGADSELSQKLIKDSVDDAIKAAASAFNYGVILGCNINLIQSIQEVLEDKVYENTMLSSVDQTLFHILIDGFKDVYRTVLLNAIDEEEIEIIDSNPKKINNKSGSFLYRIHFNDLDAYIRAISLAIAEKGKSKFVKMTDIIINYSLLTNQVFDVTTNTFSDKIINSFQTDQEILKATIDLISLLIVGNQMVVTQRNSF